jgi:hypothetical protein
VKVCFSFGGIGQSGLQQPESLIMPAFSNGGGEKVCAAGRTYGLRAPA